MKKTIKQFALSVLDYFRHKKSYSQDGEDVVLASFYENAKYYHGFYVDIGAHHPVRFSNTWMFYRKGWRGINIDPTPGSMLPFKFMRRKDINLEIGIGQKSETILFHCFNEPALNTFDIDLANERNTGKPYKIVKIIEVQTEPLSNILNKFLPKGKQIDFLTIDVEGLDLQVLQSNDWEKYSPMYVLVEDIDFNLSVLDSSPIYNYLSQKGYEIVSVLKRTIIYKKQHTQ
jgi:FkbM family methyltransferase